MPEQAAHTGDEELPAIVRRAQDDMRCAGRLLQVWATPRCDLRMPDTGKGDRTAERGKTARCRAGAVVVCRGHAGDHPRRFSFFCSYAVLG